MGSVSSHCTVRSGARLRPAKRSGAGPAKCSDGFSADGWSGDARARSGRNEGPPTEGNAPQGRVAAVLAGGDRLGCASAPTCRTTTTRRPRPTFAPNGHAR